MKTQDVNTPHGSVARQSHSHVGLIKRIVLPEWKMFRVLLMTLIFVAGMSSSAFALNLDFTLVNRSGRTFYRFYCSPINSTKWEEDLLGNDVLTDGSSVKIRIPSSYNVKYWDLRVVFQNDTEWTWTNVNLAAISRITIDRDGTAHYD